MEQFGPQSEGVAHASNRPQISRKIFAPPRSRRLAMLRASVPSQRQGMAWAVAARSRIVQNLMPRVTGISSVVPSPLF
jgi:hypothetical protein